MGTSFYHYFHPLDAPVVESSLRDLYAKGQVETPAYRFLAKDGSVVWIVSQWTLVRDPTVPAAPVAAAAAAPVGGHQSALPLTHCSRSANLQHHVNQSQSNYILSIHFVIR